MGLRLLELPWGFQTLIHGAGSVCSLFSSKKCSFTLNCAEKIGRYTMSRLLSKHRFIFLVICFIFGESFNLPTPAVSSRSYLLHLNMATFNEVNSHSSTGTKIVVGFTTDAWNVGMRKYKDFLAVHKMAWKVQKHDVRCVEVRNWSRSFSKKLIHRQTLMI